MNVAAQHSDPERIAAQQAAARRFGVAIVTSSLVVASFAFLVYVRSPSDSLQPHLVNQSGLAASGRSDVDAQLASLLNTFAQALERNDDAALRTVYPTLTPRDARILHQVRARLGTAAHLRVANVRARKLGDDEVAEEFVIVADQPTGRQLRLPFAAVMHKQEKDWKIVELH